MWLLRLCLFLSTRLFLRWLLDKLLRFRSFLDRKVFLNLSLGDHTGLHSLNFIFVVSLKTFKPRMFEELSGAWSIVSFDGEKLAKEVFGFSAEGFLNLCWKLIVGSANLIVELFVSGTPIRKLSRQYGKQENTEGPNVGWWTTVLRFADNFRCHI